MVGCYIDDGECSVDGQAGKRGRGDIDFEGLSFENNHMFVISGNFEGVPVGGCALKSTIWNDWVLRNHTDRITVDELGLEKTEIMISNIK